MFIITGVRYKRNPVITNLRENYQTLRYIGFSLITDVALNGVMLHHSGLIVQFLPRFQQLDKIRSFGTIRISIDRLCI